ncbi:hypothetical protein IFM89_006762 [Coptis chinensis]|uniref:Phytocyanin domain-containing protein n=1 Tax=Coptis chinensis TaxID=261450 RepID=A0A835IB21_9MAGN|nr:hypothetical protein IFM89_006762 [Coptis chinensis]
MMAEWTIGFDYAAWANGKEFHVGDQLVFHCTIGAHNVFKVNGTSFQDCVVPPPNEALATGSDIVKLVVKSYSSRRINGFYLICSSSLAIMSVTIPRVVLATEYKVGDDSGWTIKFDYVAWTKDKEFHVVFSYPPGAHNVHKVNATGFKDCIVPPQNEVLSTGNDVITLATPGNKWYLCGIGQHCTVGGQKLSLTVLPAVVAPSPAPASPSSAIGVAKSGYHAFVLVLMAIAMNFIV